jgi:hypothetical protein
MAWICTVLVATLALGGSASEEFDRGKTAFGRAEYARAIAIVRPLLYPETRLDSETDVVQAHRMLGVAHLFENQPDEAKQEFRKLLELRPDYRFDPLLDPPRVVEFFNGVILDEADEIAQLDAKRKQRDADLAALRRRQEDELCAARTVPIRYVKHSYALSFLPFGAGQFQNGQRRKGWTFLGIEGALGAASLGALVTNFAMFGAIPQRRCLDTPTADAMGVSHTCETIDHSQEALSRNLVRAQVITGGLFFAVAAWGIIDAVRNFQPFVSIDADPTRTGPPAPPRTSHAATARAAEEELAAETPPDTSLLPRPIPFYTAERGSWLGLEWSF